MRLLLRHAVSELRRRRLQTAVIAAVSLLTSGAATMALNLLFESDAPFQHAFAAANGPHLVVTYAGAAVGAGRLTATEGAPGVTAGSGPWAESRVTLAVPGRTARARKVLVVGRDRPDTAVDRLAMDSGRWATAPGEIVVARTLGQSMHVGVGDRLLAVAVPGQPQLTVVGVAASVLGDSGAWVRPQELPSLAEPGADLRFVVAYRVQPAATPGDIGRAVRSITAGLPPDAVVDSLSYLDVERSADLLGAVMVPFLVAFSAFALVATAFIVANVVTGVVIASDRDIGIRKSVGFAPSGVSAVLALEVLLPAVAGSVVGAAGGSAASVPFLAQAAEALGLPAPFTAYVPIAAIVLAGMVLVVLAAALAPAWRAGRLSAVAAITRGSSPAGAVGGIVGRTLARLPLPAPARLGLADVAARPLRAGMTLGAVTVGVATIVFALGLRQTLQDVAHHLIRDQYVQVEAGTAPGAPALDVERLVAADPATARSVAEGEAPVFVPGLAQPVPYFGYRGDSSWIGYALIGGRWFSGPGEVVAPTQLLRQTGLRVGDAFTARTRSAGVPVRLRLVGEILDESDGDLLLRGDWATLAAAEPGARIDRFEIQVRPGTAVDAYADRLTRAGAGELQAQPVASTDANVSYQLLQTAVAGLALVLVAIAAAGVFNTVLLNTGERVRDLAILKAVGMAPRQVTAMVVASVVGLGLVAGPIGIPLGLALHAEVLDQMAQIASGTGIPPGFSDVFAGWQLPVLAFAGVAVAVAGAWLPARWAASRPVQEVLQAE